MCEYATFEETFKLPFSNLAHTGGEKGFFIPYNQMARPERNTVDYFPFICEDGKKMYYIEETYGNDGFATLVKLLRELAKTEYHYLDLSKPTTLMFLSAKCKVSKETLTSIINDLAELGKFNSLLWKENKVIWCQDFIDNIQDAYIKRKNNCITLDGLLLLLDGLGVRKLSKQPLKVTVNPHSIVDNSIKENSKVDIPDWTLFLSYGIEKEPNVDKAALKNKYDAWIANDWKDGNDKSIKNWKSKLLQTMPYISKTVGKPNNGMVY